MRKLLIAILLIAAVLRFVGIYPGYNQFHPDEGMSYSTAGAMLKEQTLFPREGYRVKLAYPYLVPVMNLIAFKYFFVPLGWVSYIVNNLGEILDGLINFPLSIQDERRILQLSILGIREINTIFWTRGLTALFGIGNVFLIYLLGSKVSNKKAGLIAAFILTFDFRQVTNSHLGLPDIYNSFFLLLAILGSLNVWSNPTRKSYLWAGIFTGLALNTKFQFFALMPLFTAHLLATIEQNKERLNFLFNKNFVICLLLIPLLTLLINPFHFVHIEDTLIQVTDVYLKYGVGTNLLNLFPIWYLVNIDMGVVLLAISLLGVIWGLVKHFKKSLIILSVLVLQAYLFFYNSTGGFHVRNLIPITPLLIFFAAVLLERISSTIPKYLFFPLLLAIIFVPAKNSLISDYFYTKPWNFNQLSDWLAKNPLDGPVASNPTDPPTGSPPLMRTQFVQGGAFSMAEHVENGAKYALINTDWIGNSFYWWMVYHPGTISERWNKPVAKMRDSYYGLATEELLRYQIFAAVKPWQAPEANLILVEFPVWPKAAMQTVFAKEGIVMTQAGPGKTTLTPLPAKGGHLYKINVRLESNNAFLPNDRDGFLRIDFGKFMFKNISGGKPGIF